MEEILKAILDELRILTKVETENQELMKISIEMGNLIMENSRRRDILYGFDLEKMRVLVPDSRPVWKYYVAPKD